MPVEQIGTAELDISAEPAPPVAAPPEQTSGSSRKKRLPINGNNLVLAAMFVGGIVAVYVLKLSVKPESASAKQRQDELKVEAAIAQMAMPSAKLPKDGKTESVVDTLHNDARTRQIPAWVMTRNPFVFKVPKPKETSGHDGPVDNFAGHSSNVELARARAVSLARKLELQTILMAAKPMAMISGRAVTKGEKVNEWTVAAIESMRVVLTWQSENKKYELKYVLTMEGRR